MKKLIALLAALLMLSLASVASAATGNVSVPLPGVGAVNVNVAGGSNFAIDTTPNTNLSGTPLDQATYNGKIMNLGVWPADLYTVFCWRVAITPVGSGLAVNNSADWKCGVASVVAAPALVSDLPALSVTGALGTADPNECQWMLAYDPTSGCGTLTPGLTAGDESPTGPDIVPNLDPYVGQSLAFDVLTNWCSYLAAPNIDIVANLPYVNLGGEPQQVGCQADDPTFTLDSSERALSSATSVKDEVAFKMQVKASTYDCHVPKVKGLSLRKAKARLLSHHCRASVRYVKGKAAGHVRYQPLKVGTGRPRNFQVKLAVVR